MEEITGFDKFYNEKLAPSLQRLREECRQADNWGITGLVAAILGFGSFLGYHTGIFEGVYAALLFIFFAALVVVSVYKYTQRNDRFTADYKAAVIKQIMDHVCPGLVYKPDERISTREYKTSGLFRYHFDYFDGDDYMEGRVNNVPFHCSELHTRCDHGTRQKTIFKGLFIIASINSRFRGGTYILPRDRGNLSSSIMAHYHRLAPANHTVNMHFDDQAFDHYFRVTSTWPSQATEILSDEMRGQMLGICQAMKIPVSFSFAAGRCFIAIPVANDLLEPTAYDPGNKAEIRKYFITLLLIPSIIKQLGLETMQ